MQHTHQCNRPPVRPYFGQSPAGGIMKVVSLLDDGEVDWTTTREGFVGHDIVERS